MAMRYDYMPQNSVYTYPPIDSKKKSMGQPQQTKEMSVTKSPYKAYKACWPKGEARRF